MTPTRITWAQVKQAELDWYEEYAREMLDKGTSDRGFYPIQLLSLTEHREGWLWWRKTTGYRAIVATDGVYARSGPQSSPLAAVKAALMKLYPPLT